MLVLENPGLAGRHLATDALYAGLQLIMPGEFARAHRHTAAALRFIVEGENTYTAVAGERCYMRPGDFIVTPSWAWHDHRNESQEPTIWLDVLDVPLIRFLGAGFSEHYAEPEYPTTVPPGDSHLRYGRNLFPVGFQARRRRVARVRLSVRLRVRSARSSARAQRVGPLPRRQDGVHRSDDGRPGGSDDLDVPATLAARLRDDALPFDVERDRDGRSRPRPRNRRPRRRAATFEYGPKDLWAVPSWQHVTICAVEESVLFCASDEAVHRKLGVWREQRS